MNGLREDYQENSTIDSTQPAFWNATGDFAAKMNATLAPIVLNSTKIDLAEHAKTLNVHACYWSHNRLQYLLVMNMNPATSDDNGQRSVSFATGLNGPMINLFSDYPATLSKTSSDNVTGTLQPLECKSIKSHPHLPPR